MKLSLIKIKNKLLAFVKKHYLLLVFFIIIFIGIIIGVNSYVTQLVESSEIELKQKLSPYRAEKGYCFRDKDSYTIVSYELKEKPSCVGEDSSVYKQMYGNTNFYYVAKNQPWGIIQYIQDNQSPDSYYEYRIEPCAVALKYTRDKSPEAEFKQLYNYLKDGFNFSSYDLPPEEIKTDFHYMERSDAGYFKNGLILGLRDTIIYYTDTLWYDYGSDRLFFTRTHKANLIVRQDYNKEDSYRSWGIVIFVGLEILVFMLFGYLRRIIKLIKTKPLGGILNILKYKRKQETHSVDTEYEVLLHKINPINFMTPYDAEKVKIANDLYSALLKSKDNKTIVKMIREKAIKELKI